MIAIVLTASIALSLKRVVPLDSTEVDITDVDGTDVDGTEVDSTEVPEDEPATAGSRPLIGAAAATRSHR